MTGGATVSEFDVCIAERMRFREEEMSELIRFSLFQGGGDGGFCYAPRLGLTCSEADDKTL